MADISVGLLAELYLLMLKYDMEKQKEMEKNAVNTIVGYMTMPCATDRGLIDRFNNMIITSPTQVGKTSYIIKACEVVKNFGHITLISCDNSLAQLEQLKDRLNKRNEELLSAGETILQNFTVKEINKTAIKKICDTINSGVSVIILMINNDKQSDKLHSALLKIQDGCVPMGYAIIHDEGDTVNKAEEIGSISAKIPISQRKWKKTMALMMMNDGAKTRIYVSATPENCSKISGITGENILVLPKNDSYCPVNTHVEWHGDESALGLEVERTRLDKNNELILWCVDKTNIEQKNQAKDFSLKYSCVAFCYNKDGCSVYFKGGFRFESKRSVSVVLERIQKRYVNQPVIGIGYNIMNRGISMVSRASVCPLTATVMFYKIAKSGHAIGLAQRAGRLTGTSRPDLSIRKLYCSELEYKDYQGYISNQNKVWEALSLEENRFKTIFEILETCKNVVQLKRPLDRPALKSVNSEYEEKCSSVGSGETIPVDMNLSVMKRHVMRWKNPSNMTAVARVFREIIDNGGRLESFMIREIMGENGTTNLTTSALSHGYNLIFRKDSSYHYIKQEAIDYYNSL